MRPPEVRTDTCVQREVALFLYNCASSSFSTETAAMPKIVFVVALGLVLGWFGVMQFQRVEVDSAVASVSRNVAKMSITLPNLSTPAPTFEPVAMANESARKTSGVKH
jgi:hypothetical protein